MRQRRPVDPYQPVPRRSSAVTGSGGRFAVISGPPWAQGARVIARIAGACLVLGLGCSGPGDDPSQAPQGTAATTEVNAAAPGEDSEGPVRGDWMVQHLLSDPENLNPLTSSDASATDVLNWIFPRLLTLDYETLALRPMLARELPKVSEDKLTYTFELRDDVTFSDGRPLTADDVVFTLKATKNAAVRAPHLANYYESVKDAVAEGPTTVRISLREPYFRNDFVLGAIQPLPRHYYDPEGLLDTLTIPEIEDIAALPAERRDLAQRFAEQFNENYLRTPLGAGAFVLGDVVTGERIVLKRRPDFWAPDDPHYGDAWVNRILYRVINDSEAALVSFKAQQLDVLGLTPIQHQKTDDAAFAERARKQIHVSPSYSYLGWNTRRPLLGDVRVRRALGYFVDKKSIVQRILFGLGEPIEGPVFVRRAEYNRDLAPYPFDPEKGRALLAEAGWTDSDGDGVLDKEVDGKRVPLRFEIISNSGNAVRRAVGLAVIDEMKRSGIDASFRELDWSIMLERVKTSEFDGVILGWAIPLPPPDLYQVWHSSQAVEGGSNFVGYANPELDELLEAYRVEFDADARKKLLNRAQEIIYRDQPYTFLYMQKAVTAWDTRFRGVTWYPKAGTTDLGEWWVAQADQRYAQ